MKPDSKRAIAKANTRERLLAVAYGLFTHNAYEAVTLRWIAAETGMSTGAVFSSFADKAEVYAACFGFPHPWRPIAQAKKDGRLYLLLVDYREESNVAWIAANPDYVWPHTGLEDAPLARTIGHNNLENDGDDRWQMAGWCWSQDHYTEGCGIPVACIELDAVAPHPEPADA